MYLLKAVIKAHAVDKASLSKLPQISVLNYFKVITVSVLTDTF
jgi:hypothetical protein